MKKLKIRMSHDDKEALTICQQSLGFMLRLKIITKDQYIKLSGQIIEHIKEVYQSNES